MITQDKVVIAENMEQAQEGDVVACRVPASL